MKIVDWYRSLASREQAFVLFGGIAAVVMLLGGLVWQLQAAAGAAATRVEGKRADLAWAEAVAPRLQAMPSVNTDEPLTLAINRTAAEAGLGATLAGVEPAGSGAVRVRFQQASFDAIVLWLARVQQERGVVVDTASVDGTETEGLVNASVVLRGP